MYLLAPKPKAFTKTLNLQNVTNAKVYTLRTYPLYDMYAIKLQHLH